MRKQVGNVKISLYHDRRRKKRDGRYPVRLQVSFSAKRKFYYTTIDLTNEEFDKAINRDKPKGQYFRIKEELEEIFDKAVDRIRDIRPFSFTKFEKAFFSTSGAKGQDVFAVFQDKIDRYIALERLGTANNYKHAKESLKHFLGYKKGQIPERLDFEDVTVGFLEDYEYYMVERVGKSRTTVGIYTRVLRAVFNAAKEAGYTDHYPFGKQSYQPPAPKKVKKALSKNEFLTLVNAKPDKPEQEKARDLFVLSYCFAGANMKDIAALKNKDLEGDHLTFYRKKTERTSPQPITVPITDLAKQIIEKYRNIDQSPNALAFDFFKPSPQASPEERHYLMKRTVRYVNQHLKPLAKVIGINEAISYQWARHTFNTLAVQNGASLEWVQQMQGHANIKTTMNYFQGFPEEQTKEIMESLTKF